MNYREKMREYVEDWESKGQLYYGKWGALNREQRQMIRRLLDEMDRADNYIKKLFEENLQLQNENEVLQKRLKELDEISKHIPNIM